MASSSSGASSSSTTTPSPSGTGGHKNKGKVYFHIGYVIKVSKRVCAGNTINIILMNHALIMVGSYLA